MKRHIFTSESVTEGHPDKMCDRISDSILDAIIANDPDARVACETATATGLVLVMGEITTDCYVDIPSIVRNTVKETGYTRAKYGFDGDTCAVLTEINEQSPDIALGVDKGGAGDQGMMFGYACDETPELMPYPIMTAHKLARRLSFVRKSRLIPYLRPDGKTQVSVEYEDEKPIRIDTIVVSAQHKDKIPMEKIKEDITKHVILETVDRGMLDKDTKILVNPTGHFEMGGPGADSGLTGRKIIVDTYGGTARHGGGAFSGKDPTKVDRSASYAARWVAKNIVACHAAERCEIQLAYAIGVAQPVSMDIETYGTGKVDDELIIKAVRQIFDLSPLGIIRQLDLRKPVYSQTAAYGHFGRDDLDLSWERTDKAEELSDILKI
jgi:S-adenosylmethionine synthetase